MIPRKVILRYVFAAIALLAFCGCAAKAKSVVWADGITSFSDYRHFEVLPVFNATEQPVEQDVLDILGTQMRAKFKEKGLPTEVPPEVTSGVLTIRSALLVYAVYQPFTRVSTDVASSEGETTCILRTQLLDKASQRVVAEIVTVKVAGAGGVYSVPFGHPAVNTKAHEKILRDVTAENFAELYKLVVDSGP